MLCGSEWPTVSVAPLRSIKAEVVADKALPKTQLPSSCAIIIEIKIRLKKGRCVLVFGLICLFLLVHCAILRH